MAHPTRGRYLISVKSVVEDRATLMQRLLENGASPLYLNNMETDILLKAVCTSDPAHNHTLVLRKIEPEGKIILYAKEKDYSTTREAPHVTVSDFESTLRILDILGMKPFMKIEKKRSMFQMDEFHIMIDQMEGVGTFIVLGTFTDTMEGSDAIRIGEIQILERLGIPPGKQVERSYRQILREGIPTPAPISQNPDPAPESSQTPLQTGPLPGQQPIRPPVQENIQPAPSASPHSMSPVVRTPQVSTPQISTGRDLASPGNPQPSRNLPPDREESRAGAPADQPGTSFSPEQEGTTRPSEVKKKERAHPSVWDTTTSWEDWHDA